MPRPEDAQTFVDLVDRSSHQQSYDSIRAANTNHLEGMARVVLEIKDAGKARGWAGHSSAPSHPP